jgi:hypothetical protein
MQDIRLSKPIIPSAEVPMAGTQHTAHDRCDRCPAQGVTTWTDGVSALTFCGHHTARYERPLTVQGFTVLVDDRPFLMQQC